MMIHGFKSCRNSPQLFTGQHPSLRHRGQRGNVALAFGNMCSTFFLINIPCALRPSSPLTLYWLQKHPIELNPHATNRTRKLQDLASLPSLPYVTSTKNPLIEASEASETSSRQPCVMARPSLARLTLENSGTESGSAQGKVQFLVTIM